MTELNSMLRFAVEHSERHKEDLELPMFDLFTITKATDNFSDGNKLGEGGFGPVYKVILYAVLVQGCQVMYMSSYIIIAQFFSKPDARGY